MINRKYNYAVVGASNNPDKYGYKVFKDLLDSGFQVIPINHSQTEILGVKAFHSLFDYHNTIDVVVFVVPPKITEQVLLDVKKLGINNVYLQPGSESKEAINFCLRNKITCIHNACIMVSNKNK